MGQTVKTPLSKVWLIALMALLGVNEFILSVNQISIVGVGR